MVTRGLIVEVKTHSFVIKVAFSVQVSFSSLKGIIIVLYLSNTWSLFQSIPFQVSVLKIFGQKGRWFPG